jgi:hypothetical protein
MSGRCSICSKPLEKSVGMGPVCARKSLSRAGYNVSNQAGIQGLILEARNNPEALSAKFGADGTMSPVEAEQVIDALRRESKDGAFGEEPFKVDRKKYREAAKAEKQRLKKETEANIATLKHMEITGQEILAGKNIECYQRLPENIRSELSQEAFDKMFWKANDDLARRNDIKLKKDAANPKKVAKAEAVIRHVAKQAKVPQKVVEKALKTGKPSKFMEAALRGYRTNQAFESINSGIWKTIGVSFRLLQHMLGSKDVKTLSHVWKGGKMAQKQARYTAKTEKQRTKFLNKLSPEQLEYGLKSGLLKKRGYSKDDILKAYVSKDAARGVANEEAQFIDKLKQGVKKNAA